MTRAEQFRCLTHTLLFGPSLGWQLIDRCPYTAAEVAEMTEAALAGTRWRKTRRVLFAAVPAARGASGEGGLGAPVPGPRGEG